MPAVDIVIVNWNAGRQVKEGLDSIRAAAKIHWQLGQVVVVDNSSKDDSLLVIRHGGADLPLLLIENTENVGFGRACNQGARHSSSEYLLFLNPDAQIYPDTLDRCITFMESPEAERVGVCGVALIDEKGHRDRSCGRTPGLAAHIALSTGLNVLFPRVFKEIVMLDWDHLESRLVDHVMGAFYLVRRGVFQSVQGFDEDYFVGYEDLDLSMRIRYHGWGIYYLADVKTFHAGGGTSRNVKGFRLFLSLRSRCTLVRKHLSAAKAGIAMVFILFVEPCSRLLWAILRLSFAEIVKVVEAYARLYGHVLRSALYFHKRVL